MYARSTTVKGDPQKMDEAIAYVRDEGMPALQSMDGFVGLSLLCDRASGRCIATSAWETEDAMRAAAERVKATRTRGAEILGDPDPEVREWEIALLHRKREAPQGACTRVTWVRRDPAGIDEAIATYRDRVVPAIEQWYGFCSVSGLVDRGQGMGAIAVTYEGREAMEQSRAQAMALRDQVSAETGAEVAAVAEFDLVLAHLRVPETV
jgi:hypothetical protein